MHQECTEGRGCTVRGIQRCIRSALKAVVAQGDALADDLCVGGLSLHNKRRARERGQQPRLLKKQKGAETQGVTEGCTGSPVISSMRSRGDGAHDSGCRSASANG
eukprot:1146263-Pelagomonas_calceolata.AAC.6